MNIFNKILLNFFSRTLKKNTKFKDVHKGESCYIFGNGSSLKYYDLKLFNEKASIGCGALFMHKDFRASWTLNIIMSPIPCSSINFGKILTVSVMRINKVGEHFTGKKWRFSQRSNTSPV